MPRFRDLTDALTAHTNGDKNAAEHLLPQVYDRLRSLAGKYMRQERKDHTLQPTALIHEAYIALIGIDRITWQGRTHFFAMAARQMRRVLIDHARAKRSQKRHAVKTTLQDSIAVSPEGSVDLLALHEALEKLRALSPRQCDVVELRFFAGLGVRETAYILDVSPRTVDADWSVARAWLRRELGGTSSS